METLWQQQDGGYALLWKLFLHLQQYSHRLNFNYFFAFAEDRTMIPRSSSPQPESSCNAVF